MSFTSVELKVRTVESTESSLNETLSGLFATITSVISRLSVNPLNEAV